MKKLSIIYLLILILSTVAEQTENSEDTEDLIATNEWQTVKEGQKIPPGLHVRLNLETGLREAKLLDNNEQQSSSTDIIPISPETTQEEISRENLEKAFANLDLSKDDVKTDKNHEEEIRQKYRSYDELKKDFESINMKIQTDQEIIIDLIEQLNKTDNQNNTITILTDLEYYLHQYDNAILFADMNGLDLLIHLLNSTDTNSEIRQLTSLTLGAAFQGNPSVQLKAVKLGFIQYLLRLLNTELDDNTILRFLYTLSTLLRNFPQAQKIFLEHGGAELMIKIFDKKNSNDKIIIRIITLMNDLIHEKDQAMDDKREAYENIHIRTQLVDHGWCSHISTRLTSFDMNNFDSIEKIINAMISLIDVCRKDFISLIPILEKFNNLNDDSIYTDILNNIHILLTKLRQRSLDDL